MLPTREGAAQPRPGERADTHARRIGLGLILAVLLPLLVLFIIYKYQFRQLPDPATMDIAQVARNIAMGKKFTTSVVYPLATTKSQNLQAMPDLVHPPLYPHAMAIVFGASASDKKAFATASLFFLLTIPVLYALARSMFNQRVAQLTIFAFITNALMLNLVKNAGPGTMAAFLFTTMCLVLYRFAQDARADAGAAPNTRALLTKAALAGFLFALCYLTEYMLVFAAVPLALFVYYMGGRERKLALIAFLVGFAVPALPWMIRNLVLTGNPLFGLRGLEIGMGTKNNPGMSLYRTTNPQTVLGLLQANWGSIFKKMVKGVYDAYQGLPMMGHPYLMAFFLVGLFYSFRRVGVNAMRGAVLGAFLCVVVFGGLFLAQPNALASFTPILLAFAAAYFVRMLTDAKLPDLMEKGITALVIAIVSLPLVMLLALGEAPQTTNYEVEVDLGNRIAPNVPIVTDRAFEMAWYGSRTTIWLPATEKDVQNLDKAGQIKALYLSPSLSPSARTAEDYSIWRGMWWSSAQAANRNELTRFSTGTLRDFGLCRGMDEQTAMGYLGRGAMVYLRPGALR